MNVIQGSALSAEPDQEPSSSAYPGAGGPYGSYGGGSPGPHGSGGNWSGGNWSGGNWSGGGGNWSGGNWSGGGNVPPSPRHRRLRRGVVFGVAGVALAAAAAVGSYDAVQGGGSSTGHATTSANTVLSTSQITSKVSPGLVDVVSTLGDENGEAAGTGMVLTSTGEVLTNNHVIDGATSISVTDIGNGRTYKASVVGYDKTQDVAVLQLQDASGLTTVSLGNSATVSAGQSVVAIGNAEGKGGQPSVATGSVTALNQSITASDDGSGSSEQLTGMIETNAPIEPGDSGGPLVNSAGQVVGMDTAASTSSETPSAQAANPGQPSQGQSGQSQSGQSQSGQSQSGQSQSGTQAFSIPINEAVSIAAQIDGGNPSSTLHLGSTAFLGVEVSSTSTSTGSGSGAGGLGGGYGSGSDGGYGYGGGYGSSGDGGYGYGSGDGGTSTTSGVQIEGALSGSPAASAGLSAGDVITSIGGQSVTSATQMQSIIAAYHPGDKVSMSWTDASGQTQTATVTFASGPAD
jgi:S1-C subfamily serine protease